MKRYFKSSISAMAMSALVMGGVAATVSLSAVPAFSKSENASDGGERSEAKGDNRSERGAEARSRGSVNAFHANAMAFENASSNSHMGMIEVYKAAVMASAEADAALASFIAICGEPIDDEVPPLSDDCKELLKVAELDYFNYLNKLKGDVDDTGDLENDALELAANKETDDAVIEALWDLLLPEDL